MKIKTPRQILSAFLSFIILFSYPLTTAASEEILLTPAPEVLVSDASMHQTMASEIVITPEPTPEPSPELAPVPFPTSEIMPSLTPEPLASNEAIG